MYYGIDNIGLGIELELPSSELELNWNCHHRNWNWIALRILYRIRNWIGIAIIGIGIGIELQKRNWPRLWSNPRYWLGCATQKIDLHSFIFLQLLFLYPVHNPFLPILRQPVGEASPFSSKNVSCMCLEGSIIPLMCLESKMISPFTHKKWRG